MKPFRKIAAGLFGFDRRERRGTYVLSAILIVILLVRFTAFRPGRVTGDINDIPPTDEILQASTKDAGVSHTLFPFDPNTVSYADLLLLGLSERQAGTLVKYREAGARFRKPADLRRVYGIDSASAVRLMPYIIIESGSGESGAAGETRSDASRRVASPTEGTSRYAPGVPATGDAGGAGGAYRQSGDAGGAGGAYRQSGDAGGAGGPYRQSAEDDARGGGIHNAGDAADVHPKRGQRQLIDLNRCTAAELVILPGIGPVLSERIIKYRSLLGGFVDKRQLTEVYGLDSTVVSLIASRVTLTLDSVEPLCLDSASFGDLARHPYVGYEAARLITRYRSLANEPLTLGSMVSRNVITPRQAERMAPYVRPSAGAEGTGYEFISSKVLK